MMDELNALNAPKKVVDGLTEVFEGLAQMFEGVSDQLELLGADAAIQPYLPSRIIRPAAAPNRVATTRS